jgi:hypothetical protein
LHPAGNRKHFQKTFSFWQERDYPSDDSSPHLPSELDLPRHTVRLSVVSIGGRMRANNLRGTPAGPSKRRSRLLRLPSSRPIIHARCR